ncbi:MAG TPA: hypothetical protein VGM69_27275 [Chloroflexota bacterium]|jgi:hypothetical protein
MAEQFDLDEILKANPHIDRAEFERLRDALGKRRAPPVPAKERNVTSPFKGRRVTVKQDAGGDARTVRLRRST